MDNQNVATPHNHRWALVEVPGDLAVEIAEEGQALMQVVAHGHEGSLVEGAHLAIIDGACGVSLLPPCGVTVGRWRGARAFVAAYCSVTPGRRTNLGKLGTSGRIPRYFGQICRHFCCPLPLAAWHLRLPPPVKECRLALEEFRCR